MKQLICIFKLPWNGDWCTVLLIWFNSRFKGHFTHEDFPMRLENEPSWLMERVSRNFSRTNVYFLCHSSTSPILFFCFNATMTVRASKHSFKKKMFTSYMYGSDVDPKILEIGGDEQAQQKLHDFLALCIVPNWA